MPCAELVAFSSLLLFLLSPFFVCVGVAGVFRTAVAGYPHLNWGVD